MWKHHDHRTDCSVPLHELDQWSPASIDLSMTHDCTYPSKQELSCDWGLSRCYDVRFSSWSAEWIVRSSPHSTNQDLRSGDLYKKESRALWISEVLFGQSFVRFQYQISLPMWLSNFPVPFRCTRSVPVWLNHINSRQDGITSDPSMFCLLKRIYRTSRLWTMDECGLSVSGSMTKCLVWR